MMHRTAARTRMSVKRIYNYVIRIIMHILNVYKDVSKINRPTQRVNMAVFFLDQHACQKGIMYGCCYNQYTCIKGISDCNYD